MEQAAQPAITNEELDNHIEKERKNLYHIARTYRRGLLSNEDMIGLYGNEIRDGFFRYLDSNGLRLHPHIEKNWHRFLEDHDLYKKHMEPNSQHEEPWLRFRDENDHAKFYEAATADKVSFFTLMEEFHLPAEYFKPISEHCIVPNLEYLPTIPKKGFDVAIVYKLADAGGLDFENDPVGKSFTLVDEHGLKAELEIRWKIYVKRHDTEYSAFGTIEGYTTARKRRIEISALEDNRIRFITKLDIDDMNTYGQFPLWKEYRKESAELYDLQLRSVQSLADHYKSLVTDDTDGRGKTIS